MRGEERGVSVWHNELPKKHWLNVQLAGAKGNAAALSAKIRLYPSTATGEPRKLWLRASGRVGPAVFTATMPPFPPKRHFGLGKRERVDVEVEFYPSGRKVLLKDVGADRTVLVNEN